ncbi:hypothetical protein [Azospirillum sp.]|uniref:hypothetical protein n=1 Tax=Azospirillum sp. TaxID=34012 RepID=UPI002D2234F5|nr:hypothetical protein [Azospirillum sp.]HYF90094.1 hypothetical protein [Azospirillum sp.]
MDLVNWKSRLAVKYKAEGGQEKLISPIDSFQPSFALNAEALHSCECTHIGVVYSPSQVTFSISVKAMGTAAAELMMLAIKGTPFDIVLVENDGGFDWVFKEVALSHCVITSTSPSNATIAGAPAATFSGFSLIGAVSSRAGSAKVGMVEG